jgi:hypothetical protein
MPESAGSRLAAGAHPWARLSLALLVIGPSILLVNAWVEVLNNPGLSLVDAYWIGREPWTSIGIVVSHAGGVGGLLAGSVAIVIEGGWWRRLLVVPSLAAGLLWWSFALGVLPYPRFVGPDPVTFAFTLPATAALFVLMPAALLAVLCLTPRMRSTPRTRLRPVPSAALKPRTSLEAEDDLELDDGGP